MTVEKQAPASGSILVVGGGISGLTTALEAAEVGYEVFIVEKNPYLAGRKSSAIESVFSEAMSSDLRAGDQLQTDQGQSQNQDIHAGGSGKSGRLCGQL